MTNPAKISTRKTSRIAEEMSTLVSQLKARKDRLVKKIERLIEQISNKETLESWTKGDVCERQSQLKNFSVQLEKVHEDALVELDSESLGEFEENEELNDKITTAKARLFDQLEALSKAEPSQNGDTSIDKNKIKIEVMQTDASGNVPNTWGKFDGDYSKWKSFHDKWIASMHNNDKVKTIIKFQNLQAACVGSAKGALGEWDLTDENYEKAWDRLQSIYEDDYMQVQSFMQKITVLPQINGLSSKTIRDTINTVQKHIHGLQRYISMDAKHPYVVFAVIGKMDTDTYRAWEKHRPSLAKADAVRNGIDPDDARPGKYIPTWKELESFLENEVTIRVHAERHSNYETPQQNAVQISNKQQQKFNKKQRFIKKREQRSTKFTEMLQCPVCKGSHTIYSCEMFSDMNLIGRQNQVAEHELCVRCLQKFHSGECENRSSNRACPRCLPESKYHNSLLCPNVKVQSNIAMKATGSGKKRKHNDNKHQNTKRRRHNNASGASQNKDRTQSVVNRVGEWSLVAKQTNAIKKINPKEEGKFEQTILLATLNMHIQISNSNKNIICRAIADTGATLNCVTANFVEENKLSTIKCQKRVLGISGPEIIRHKIKATVSPWFQSKFAIEAEFFILKHLDGVYPDRQIDVAKDQIMHLVLADEKFDEPSPINALIGAEMYSKIIGPDLYKNKDGAMMQSSEFGHLILGKFNVKNKSSDFTALNISQINEVSTMLNNKSENKELENALSKFWYEEETNKCTEISSLSEEQLMVEQLFEKTHYREQNGRYVVTIPIKPNCKGLGDSKVIAKRQFKQLEQRFKRNPELKRKYVEYMHDNIKQGYMRLAKKPAENELCYWLPHHAVIKKFRVVLNGSAVTTNGESLNSIQMKGPKLQFDSQLQTMRFRRHKYAVATDITKMFNRVGLNSSQWNLHRLFWRESEDEPIKQYVMTVVIFGGTSSAYNSVKAMQQCAKDYAKEYPEASNIITKSFYMDDGIFGNDTIDELKVLCKEVEFVLSQGHFMLKGWASNSEEVEKYLNTSMINEIIIGEKDEEKILGLRWLKITDELSIVVKLNENKDNHTKRSILSEIARLYDPNGFIAPIIIKAKMLMQDIWRLEEIGWDENVPPEINRQWSQQYADLPMLSKFKIKRWLATNKTSKIQIHGFCDASNKAYGVAIFVRAENENNEICCSLLSAKSKVAPLKEMTIPRLELLGALMLSEQVKAVVKACEFENADVTLWSDSMIALSWIKKQPCELKAFVSNRVQTIQERTKHYKWKHVRSEDNTADLISRGMNMQDFLKSELWLKGPPWLRLSEANWPKPKLVITPETKNEITKECKPKLPEQKAFKLHTGVDNTLLYNKFQSWDKIINITAYIFRAYWIAKKQKELIGKRFITSNERINAIEFWVKYEQSIAFKKEIDCIRTGDMLPTKSSITSLRPFLDKNGILRVGGRIDKANIAYESKHQYIIPHKSRLSFLLLKHAHEITMHGGAQLMTQFIRRKFWIQKLRFETRNFTRTCVRCVRLAQQTAKQIMAELPEIRLKPAPPFQNVGVDMAGPYQMRISNKINVNTRARALPDMKGWIAVFVCLITRAIHLEAVEGMSADDFLVAYTKFTSRRGNPEKIYSDHGTNFIGADSELKSAMESWQCDQIQRYVHLQGTEWHYITPSAPHEGGIWEAAVKQMKHHLKRVIGVQKYSFQGITTLLAGVEACLNSRPLCKMTDDPDDHGPLTPAHFLIGRPLKLPMQEKSNAPPYSMKRLYVQLQFQIQAFWKQWSEDYLQSLIQLPKWRTEYENMQIGQLVIIKAENIPPTYWAMGRITQIHKGHDAKVRSVSVKTQTGQLERSIRKICILPNDVDLSYWK